MTKHAVDIFVFTFAFRSLAQRLSTNDISFRAGSVIAPFIHAAKMFLQTLSG
jgi:hypothetical protein